jgi:hypothetical protein
MIRKNVHTSVSIYRRRGASTIAEVKLLEGNEYLIPDGIIFCEVECIPEVIKALKLALKTAEEDEWRDYYADVDEEGESHE